MTTPQQNKVTMLEAVLAYLAGDGNKLAAIKLIGQAAGRLQKVVGDIQATAGQQDKPTTGVTRSREDVKAEASTKAEVLRLLVRVLSPDATTRAQLKQPLSKVAQGKDDDYLRYLAAIVAAVGTLAAEQLNNAGYDPQVLTTLTTDLAALTATQGAARQIELGTSTATDKLSGLLQEADEVLDTALDPLVNAQKLALSDEVTGYNKARRIIHSAATRRPRFAGKVAPGTVGLVLDRRATTLPDPTLANRSAKGLALRFYTAATPTAAPAAGQGLLLKARATAHLDSYVRLGPDPDAPYLLVQLEGPDGEGHWVVK